MKKEKFAPIDIPSPKFFWLLQPWKEGKLATIDGWGRFAEISFIGANRMKITPLVNFPRVKLDRELITWPEAGLITSRTSERLHHIAAIDDNKTKSHIPLLTWTHYIYPAVLLDPLEGLIAYSYALKVNESDIDTNLFVYNYKEDRIVYQSPERGNTTWMLLAIDEKYQMSYQKSFDGKKKEFKAIFLDWRTGEIVENDFTKTRNQYEVGMLISPCRNIHLAKRYMFGYSDILKKRVKLSWDEGYSDIKITPLSYLEPEGKGFTNFILSIDGRWGTTLVYGYRGLHNERLCKRAFFHLDERYPNGISIPIITEDYEEYQRDYSAFVEHPVHGQCLAQEWRNGKKLYLRLYRMSDVLDEINRQLLEKATCP